MKLAGFGGGGLSLFSPFLSTSIEKLYLWEDSKCVQRTQVLENRLKKEGIPSIYEMLVLSLVNMFNPKVATG